MPAPRKSSTKPAKRRSRGFLQTGGLLTKEIREASSQRGFSQTRLLTQWAEIVGASVAKICQPVRVSYAKNGFGATLTLLTSGANAPMLQMQLPQIRERVNASYGYNAISRITITQTAPSGFGEPVQQEFERRKSAPNPETLSRIQGGISDVKDDRLKDALLKLGENIATRNSSKNRTSQ